MSDNDFRGNPDVRTRIFNVGNRDSSGTEDHIARDRDSRKDCRTEADQSACAYSSITTQNRARTDVNAR